LGALELAAEIRRELTDHVAGEIVDHAGAAAILRHRPGQRQVRQDRDARRRAVRLEREMDVGLRTAAPLRVAAFRPDTCLAGRGVLFNDLGLAREVEHDRTQAYRDLALVAAIFERLLEARAGHARG